MKRILVVGELNVDLVLQGLVTPATPGREVLAEHCALTLGSSSAICAMGLARLGDAVSFASVVGGDAYADLCVRTLQQAGIDVARVVRDSSLMTGITVVISAGNDRSLVTYLGAIAAQTGANLDDEWLSTFEHVHVSSYFLQAAFRPRCRDLFARASRLGLTTSMDPGFDPSQTWGDDLVNTLQATDVFLPNEVELAAITRTTDALTGLRSLENGRTITVVKLGAGGCLTLQQGSPVRAQAFAVDVVDTTGAGDSFNAGFLHTWLRGAPIAECLRRASACGALSTLGLGGTDRQPSAAQLDEFLHQST